MFVLETRMRRIDLKIACLDITWHAVQTDQTACPLRSIVCSDSAADYPTKLD